MTTDPNGALQRRLLRSLPIFALIAILVGLAGCDNVGVQPKSSATANNVFTNDEAYRQYFAKLYAGLNVTGQDGPTGDPDIEAIADEGFSQYMRLYWQMQELPTDEAVIAYEDGSIQELNQGTWNADNSFLGGMYSRISYQVVNVNNFLRQSTSDRLQSRGISDDIQSQIPQWRAEARFLRALSYYHGMDIFGGIPIIDESFPIGGNPPPQATRAEVFDFIEDELVAITDGEGEEELPDPGQNEYGRADKAAAWMVLANLYLNADEVYLEDAQGDFDIDCQSDCYAEAADYAARVIDSGYDLDPEYHNLFLADNHTADGIIFAIPHDGQRTQHYGGTQFLTHAAVIESNDAMKQGEANTTGSDFGIDFGYSGLRTTQQFVDIFEMGDQRPVFPNTPGNQFFQTGQTKDLTEGPDLTDPLTGYAVPKFQNRTSDGGAGSNPTFPDTDYPLFRLAEAHLIYAEAVVRGNVGDPARAVSLVNDLRERAGFSRTVTQGSLTLDFILDERGRELFWEAKRRTDLIRFGLFTGGQYSWAGKAGRYDGTGAYADGLALYPIPANELILNTNLTQNEGY
jgi:hypothetical protein